MSGNPLPKSHYSRQKAFLRWGAALCLVVSAYGATALLLYSSKPSKEPVKGTEQAVMLEFAHTPTAPVVEHEADILQPETIIEESNQEEVVEEEPEIAPEAIETPPSDMVEEVKKHPTPVKPKKPEPKKPEPKKIEPKKPTQQKPTPVKPDAKISKKVQSASAPSSTVQAGSKFAAPAAGNKRGQGGHADPAWKQKVQAKINGVARRVSRQNPGVNGDATVLFSYDGNGNVKRTSLSKSTGKKNADIVALKIAKQSSPLPPPPGGQAGEVVMRVQIQN